MIGSERMTAGRMRTLAVAAGALCLLAGGAPAVRAQSRTIELKYVSGGPAAEAATARTLLGPRGPIINIGQVKDATIGGWRVKIAARRSKNSLGLGMDCDADGRVLGKEWRVIRGKGKRVAFDLKITGVTGSQRDYSVSYGDLTVQAGREVKGLCRTNCAWEGELDKVKVRFLDDDLNGRLTQDGKDAILIGEAATAVPLMRVHRIGSGHYDVQVAEDGAVATFKLLRDTDLSRAIVLPPPEVTLACLVVRNDAEHAYDLTVAGPKGVPGGTYRLCYGLLRLGKREILLRPDKEGAEYSFKQDKKNTVPVGPPMKVSLGTKFAPGKVTILAASRITGAGGEILDLGQVGKLLGARLHLMDGDKSLSNVAIRYGPAGFPREFSFHVPKGMTREKGKVRVTVTVRGLGTAVGEKTLKQIAVGP